MMSGQRSDPYAFVDDVDAETDLEMALKDVCSLYWFLEASFNIYL